MIFIRIIYIRLETVFKRQCNIATQVVRIISHAIGVFTIGSIEKILYRKSKIDSGVFDRLGYASTERPQKIAAWGSNKIEVPVVIQK